MADKDVQVVFCASAPTLVRGTFLCLVIIRELNTANKVPLKFNCRTMSDHAPYRIRLRTHVAVVSLSLIDLFFNAVYIHVLSQLLHSGFHGLLEEAPSFSVSDKRPPSGHPSAPRQSRAVSRATVCGLIVGR